MSILKVFVRCSLFLLLIFVVFVGGFITLITFVGREPCVGGSFRYRVAPCCYFAGRGVQEPNIGIGQMITNGGQYEEGNIYIERPDGLPEVPRRPFSHVVPNQIVRCHVSKDAIFGETRVPEERRGTVWDKNEYYYDGWFFLDLSNRVCYQMLTKKKYEEILNLYKIPEEERILTDPMKQDRNQWPNWKGSSYGQAK